MHELVIGRLRGGWCVSWRDGGKRRRHQLKARTEAEAAAEARDVYYAAVRKSRGLTVSDLWEGYRVHLGTKPTAETMRHTGVAVLGFFGPRDPETITERDCRDYRDRRAAQGRKPGTIWTELGHLRGALSWGAKTGKIRSAPHIEMPPKPASTVKPMTDAEVARVLDACAAPHLRLATTLLLTTGGRQGAILDLTWDRVDFEAGVIDLRLPDGVTRKGRATIPMNRTARAALQGAHALRRCGHVVEWHGRPIKSIRTGYKAALVRAGLSGITVHQIRHTVAVRMLRAGIPIEKVAQYLGHSNPKVTYQVYARFLPGHMADAAEVLELPAPRALKVQ